MLVLKKTERLQLGACYLLMVFVGADDLLKRSVECGTLLVEQHFQQLVQTDAVLGLSDQREYSAVEVDVEKVVDLEKAAMVEEDTDEAAMVELVDALVELVERVL